MSKEKFDTLRIHGGYDPAEHNNSAQIPIYQTAAFTLGTAAQGDAVASGVVTGSYTYSRVGNPTVATLEKRIAALDGGVDAVAVGSGMAAITYAILNVAEGGGRIIAPYDIYGAALDEFETLFPKFGINFDLVEDINDIATIKKLIKPDTKAIYAESVSNPTTEISDIEKLAEVAHNADIPLIIDNTFSTPYLFQPIKYGADIVVYSSTKGISGHGNVVSGLIVDGGNFDWDNGKYPQFQENEYSLKNVNFPKNYSFSNVFGKQAYIKRIRMKYVRLMGAVLGPVDAYLELLGLETITERIDKEVATSLKIAQFLADNPQVKKVYYSGLPGADQYDLAQKYFPKGIGTVLSFELDGTSQQTDQVIDATHLFLYLPNVGDSRSLIVNPSKITHREIPEERRIKSGVTDQLLRLSIGLEDADDLINDLNSAINATFKWGDNMATSTETDFLTKIIQLRHEFHQNPELSNQEFQTTKRIAEILTDWQIPIEKTDLDTGLLAVIEGNEPGPTIALRADIDALPIQEQTDIPFKSQNPGVMHACGHDLHLSSLLGAAYQLNQQKDSLKGTIKLLFQPAEEEGHGGDQVLDKHVLDGVEAIIGFHNQPDLPVGEIALKSGALMAGCYHFDITIEGKGAHAAQPQNGTDVVVTQAAIVTQLQTIVSRNQDPFHAVVVSVTKVNAGKTWNVLPETATLEGTVRTFNQEDTEKAKQRLIKIAKNTAATYNQTATVNWTTGADPINNNEKITNLVKQGLTKKVTQPKLTMTAEDFATFETKIPGTFAFIGSNGSKEAKGVHDPNYKGKDETIKTGIQYFIESAKSVLEGLDK